MKSYRFDKKIIFHMFTVLLVVFSMLAQVTPARAATITVSNTLDSGAGSLRQALIDAAAAGDIINFSATLSGQTIILNSPLGSPAGITKSVEINGSALVVPITLSGNSVSVFMVAAAGVVTLDSLKITNGLSTTSGGGISNAGILTVKNSTFSGNTAITVAGNGGAISNTGTLTVDNSTFSGNTAAGSLGGGAIANTAPGTLTVKNSTFSGNTATGVGSNGGGIYNSAATVVGVYNSTFSANNATSGGGGGLYNINGTLEIKNSTLWGNTASSWGGGINNSSGSLSYANTIIGNSGVSLDCYLGGGTVTLNTKNMVLNNAAAPFACSTPFSTVDPLLGPLASNGGPTQTMALLNGSPAVGAGDAVTCATAGKVGAKDQRGTVRPQGTGCDIGAFEAVVFTLTVTKTGTGTGTVTSSPAGIDCGATCTKAFNSGAAITLTAVPTVGSTLSGWTVTGVPAATCPGTGTCTVTMDVARTVTANFVPSASLAISKTGTGSGTVTSSPAGIACGGTCLFDFALNTVVTLTAVPDAGAAFSGWSGGGCSGTGTCMVTMDAAKLITAGFSGSSSSTFTMTVAKAGTGAGTVTSAPAGIACGATCSFAFNTGTVVTLTAAASAGSTFTGWSGAGCSGTGTCVVTMSAAQAVTATFSSSSNTLTVVKTGAGTGTVTSAPAGIACGATCSFSFAAGTVVTLTAAPDAGITFTGWSGGGCSGTGTCVVTMSAAQTVIATFGAATANNLTVIKAGTGTGTVTSAPVGIACGSVCLYPFTINAVVTLTAVPDASSTFSGWSGAGCTGTGTCVVTMSAAQSVTATFASSTTYTLSVSKTGSGTGTVTSSPAGITCGATCSSAFASGTVVTLTAVPDAGIPFGGWSGGGCTGTGTCVVTMSSAQSVTATFGISTSFDLTVTKAGTGTGTVTSAPAGIICGSTCSFVFASGTLVTLTPSPDAGSAFGGWSGGGCSGTGACVVTMSAIKSVTATFNIATTYTLSVSKVGNGTVTSSPIGIACGAACSSAFSSGTVVTLTAVSEAGSSFTSWSGTGSGGAGCPVTGTTCAVTMSAAQSVTALFDVTTFGDVAINHPQYKYIQALWDGGFTSGCSVSPLMFCPDRILDRAESAVFMLRAVKGAQYIPPSVPTNVFADNWTLFLWAKPWAEGMYQAGLTTGCQTNPLMFCPDQKLSRVQASIFGLRIKYGQNYVPPTATGTLFADFPATDPSYSWGIAWTEKAYLDGLLPACGTDSVSGKPKFCPFDLVNRGWAAYLIVEAKGLPIP